MELNPPVCLHNKPALCVAQKKKKNEESLKSKDLFGEIS